MSIGIALGNSGSTDANLTGKSLHSMNCFATKEMVTQMRDNTLSRKNRDLKNNRYLRLLIRKNIRCVRKRWIVSVEQIVALKRLTEELQLSVASGDLMLLEGKWYVSHGGLLRIAQRNHCAGMRTAIEKKLSDPASARWVFKATVYKSPSSPGFVGYGDADPSNVSSLVHGAEMRVAETRAVNRALRKAYGIGLCSVEELGSNPRSRDAASADRQFKPAGESNGDHNGQPRLRDRLCLLIRQYQLDAGAVKAYAADFCGTATLREASRDMVEAFINELAERAAKDRSALICQLNSYVKPQETTS
jgi:hypothetical protein